ncbi:MAG: tetratricopeptide repeat protein [Ignavibacteriales bacterium]|nr:tetratricopeptide repeat protein [Ignavibacteriales bacterium]
MPRRRKTEAAVKEAAGRSDRQPSDERKPSLLKTKLSIPCLRAGLVSRPRLVERLHESLGGRLTLVSAPAGFGKTTLLTEWTCGTKHKVCSVSLDENDNNVLRFWSYFLGALQTLDPNLGETTSALLGVQRTSPHSTPESFLTPLVNEIGALKYNVALILDDYHFITNPAIHEGIAFFLDRMPPQMHLIITSRADPPLPLARLRARNQLRELRARDLRFTSEEAARFLNQVMGLHLPPKSIAALEARTEGWVVGLQLAGLSMQGRDIYDYSSFIDAFTGSHRFVVDYLAEEVFNTQPEEIRRFLLHTSILERLSGPLCDAVTGQTHGASILANLEKHNLFTVPLDANRDWYRYHQLFLDVLRHRLQSVDPGLVPDLHRRASEWFEQHGQVNEAVNHAFAAKDFERAANIVEKFYDDHAATWESLLTWLDAFPPDLVRSRPVLSLARAWATVSQDRLQDAMQSIRDVEQWAADKDTSSSRVRSIIGEAAAVRSVMAVVQDDALGIINAAQRALEYLPEEKRYLRGTIKTQLGIAHLFLGDVRSARRAAVEGLRVGREIASQTVTYYAHLLEGGIERELGRPGRSLEALNKALEAARTRAGSSLPLATIAYRNLADMMYEMNDLQGSLNHLNTALELSKSWWVRDEMIKSYVLLARIHEARHDKDNARVALKQAETLADNHLAVHLIGTVGLPTLRHWLAEGFFLPAIRWAEQSTFHAGDIKHIHQYHASGVLARLLMAQDRFELAVEELEKLVSSLEGKPLADSMIEALVLLALAKQSQGRFSEALEFLNRALSLSRPEGYVRTFLDEGDAMYALLSRVTGKNRRHAITLLSAFDVSRNRDLSTKSITEIIETRGGVLVEPLSKRERELIPFLADGLSNQEIARRLYISPDTVKVHLKHIYHKFGVNNRTQALARARELSLL